MPKYSVTYEAPMSIFVTVDADSEEHAGEVAWGLAEECLRTIGGNYRDIISVEVTLDGIGADTVKLVDGQN